MFADAQSRVGPPCAVPVVPARTVSGRRAVDEHHPDARPVAKLAAGAKHGEVVGRRRRRVVGLHVQEADVEAVDLPGETAAGTDRHEIAIVVETDAAAEEEINLLTLADAEET